MRSTTTKINCIYPTNLDEYLKPLDIVKLKNKKGEYNLCNDNNT